MPSRNWIVGLRYWSRPSVVSESFLAASAKSSKGAVVAGPRPTSQTLVANVGAGKLVALPPHHHAIAQTAAGARIIVSSVSPSSAPSVATLRSRP
jgi:hypothetical protein